MSVGRVHFCPSAPLTMIVYMPVGMSRTSISSVVEAGCIVCDRMSSPRTSRISIIDAPFNVQLAVIPLDAGNGYTER